MNSLNNLHTHDPGTAGKSGTVPSGGLDPRVCTPALRRGRTVPRIFPGLSQLFWSLCLLAVAATAVAQTPSTLGLVARVDADARVITLKTDAGQEMTLNLQPNASFRRVKPGETSLANAEAIALADVASGDRVLARGKVDGSTVAATLIVVMSQSDISKKQAGEQADWDKRGVTGLVSAVAPDSVTITVRTLAGSRQVVIKPAPNAVIRRYAPDSVKFSGATPSALADVKTGDQVRARGDRTPDGGEMTAEEIVSGTFKTIAAVIVSVDPAESQMQVRDLESKKTVVVKVNPDSKMQKLPPQLAQMIATRLHGGATPATPPQGAPREGGSGPGGPGAGGFAGRRAGGGDFQQMLDRSPAVALADLKTGDAIVVSSTVGAAAGKITAITLLAGVEPILTKPGTQDMSLGSWSLDMGGGIGVP